MAQLREKIYSQYPEHKSTFENAIFCYGSETINEQKFLAFYNINDTSVIETTKCFNPKKNYGLKFVRKPDAITLDNDNQLRAEVIKSDFF